MSETEKEKPANYRVSRPVADELDRLAKLMGGRYGNALVEQCICAVLELLKQPHGKRVVPKLVLRLEALERVEEEAEEEKMREPESPRRQTLDGAEASAPVWERGVAAAIVATRQASETIRQREVDLLHEVKGLQRGTRGRKKPGNA